MSLRDLGKKHTFDSLRDEKGKMIKVSVDQMINVYNKEKNPYSKAALVYGNHIPEPAIYDIINSLTADQKQLGDFIRQDFKNNYNRFREAAIELTNEDPGWQPEYTPMTRTERDYKTLNEYILKQLAREKMFARAGVEKGFFEKRKKIPKEYQKPIKLAGAYEEWCEQVAIQEHTINFGKKINELNRIVEHPKFRSAVTKKRGRAYLDAVKSYINHVADPEFYRAFELFDQVVMRVRQNIALAYLSGNVLTMAKQFPSLAIYLADAGPYHLMRSMLEFSFNPPKMIKFVNEMDPQVKHRSIERELEELRLTNKSAYDKLVRKVGRAGMVGIRMVDRAAVTIGWNAVYQKNVRKMGVAKAVQMASEATLRTQPTARAKDIPQIYRMNVLLNIPLQFTRQLSQLYNIWTYDMITDLRRARFINLFYAMIGATISAVWIWSIVNQKFPETFKEYREALTDQWLGMVPLAGKPLLAQAHGHGAQESPLWNIAQGISSVWTTEDQRKWEIMLEGWALMGGFPYTGAKRAIEAIETGEPKKLLGRPPKQKRRR